MLRLMVKRLLISIPVLFIVTLFVFLMLHLAPGDPARRAAGGQQASAAQVEQARQRLGLNDPLPVQYGRYVKGLVTGDLGRSIFSDQRVTTALWGRAPVSFSLMLGALIVALLMAIPAGTLAAVRPGGMLDRGIMLLSAGGIAMPSFFIGLVLVLFFALKLSWFPATGYVPIGEGFGPWAQALALPWATLGFAAAAEISRFMRASLRDVLDQDFIRTARAKGMSSFGVIGKHAMKNAFIPVLTVIGLQIRFLLGGTVVVEQVFALPGLGSLAVSSVFNRDYPLIQGIAISTALVVVVVNLFVDVLYGYLNPRLRAQ